MKKGGSCLKKRILKNVLLLQLLGMLEVEGLSEKTRGNVPAFISFDGTCASNKEVKHLRFVPSRSSSRSVQAFGPPQGLSSKS